MKKVLFAALFAAAIAAGQSAVAQSMSLGIDGITFGAPNGREYEKSQNVEVGVPIWYSSRSFTVGRGITSTIPTFEIGWNILGAVDYSPYEGMGYGRFFDIRNWKSTQVTVNFVQASVFNRRKSVGMSIALGIRANNYRLKSSHTLAEYGDLVVPSPLSGDIEVKKSKFTTAALHIPVELSFINNNKFAVSVGGFADLMMNSHTKIKYKGGSKDKEHNFPVNFVQAGASFRLSFSCFSVYCNYTPTQLFKSGCGPEMQVWTIGIGI